MADVLGEASASPTVLNISAGPDTGGQMIRTKNAFDRLSGWSMRSVVTTERYFAYGRDLLWRNVDVGALWDAADVVHVHRDLAPFRALDRRAQRPILFHHHGTALRQAAPELLRQADYIGAVNVVSTIDLLRYAPDATWLPSLFDLPALEKLRQPNRSEVIRIVHAPTSRKVKGTAIIEAVVRRLARKYPIEFTIVENRPWAECLAAKARADIVIDQLLLGYGNNALEAWAMGIPVVAGAEPDTRALMTERLFEIPFYEATPEDLYTRLEALVADPALRREWGRRGRAYVRAWHSDVNVVAQLEGLYARAIAQRKPVTAVAMSNGQPYRNRLQPFEASPGVWLRMTPAMAEKRGLVKAGV